MDDEPPTHIDAAEETGTVVGGRYRIISLIATGGMARVFQATDEILSRPVAVKVLHEHLLSDEAFVARFHHEAIAAARLSHPSIVSIFDTVSEPGCEAIVMVLVRGTTLRRRLDVAHTLDVDQTVAVGSQVADALDTAHRARVVHRDIKPANILLSTDGRVLVADFGIAKAAEGADLTAEGSMLGTAKYLAPEQVEGAPVDGRTDVYSLGIVLFETLCGRVPFLADTDTGTALARLHHPPMRPRQVRAEIPRPIEDVVMRAMARHPDDRFGDAAQLRAALLHCVSGRPTVDVPVDDTVVLHARGSESAAAHTPIPVPSAPSSGPEPGPDEADAEPPGGFGKSERAWLVPTLLIVLVAIALGVVGVLFGQSGTGKRFLGANDPTPTTVAPTVTPTIRRVQAFDPPPGDGIEDDQDLGKLTDGDPSTFWHTETYDAAPLFGVKEGVGLNVELDGSSKLHSLVVNSPSAGWNARVYVSKGAPGATLASWGKPVADKSAIAAGSTTFDLNGRTGTHVLLWITRLTASGRVTISGVQLQ